MIKSYFRDIWWSLKGIPEDLIDAIIARDEYHWFQLKYTLSKTYSEIIHPLHCLKRGIKNLYRWFNVIWFDRDYDHYYFKIVIEKKLQFMEEFFRSDRVYSTTSKHTAKQIAYLRKLIKMSINPPTPNVDKHYEKYGDTEFKSEPIKWDVLGKPMLYEIKSEKTKEQTDEFLKAIHKDNEYELNINKHLYNFMRKRINSFWD